MLPFDYTLEFTTLEVKGADWGAEDYNAGVFGIAGC
jgi:hypothetical protein